MYTRTDFDDRCCGTAPEGESDCLDPGDCDTDISDVILLPMVLQAAFKGWWLCSFMFLANVNVT